MKTPAEQIAHEKSIHRNELDAMLSLIGKTVPPKPMGGNNEEALAHSKNNLRARRASSVTL